MKKLKEYRAFLRGAAVTLAVLMLAGTVSATAFGQVSFNQAGIRVFGESKAEAGQLIQAPNGQEVPSVITYTDARGGKTNYLSIGQLARLLDMEVAWNSEKNTVDIATYGGRPSATIHIVGDGENMTVTPGEGVDLSVVNGPEEFPDKPEYGVTHGAFREVDPATVDTTEKPVRIFLQDTRIAAEDIGCPTMMYEFSPDTGKYVLFEVTNNGTTEQVVQVARQTTIAASRREKFTSVSLAPGETLTRAFELLPDSTHLECRLLFDVNPANWGRGTDITVSLTQYE